MPRVDYSELVLALQDGDEDKANELLEEVMPKLVEYLRVVMKASPEEAKECAYQSFLDVLEQINKGNIKENKYIFSYLITTSKNEYIRSKKFEYKFTGDPKDVYNQIEPAQQVENLVESERMQILEECLQELDPESRRLMRYLLKNPDKSTKQVSKKFGLTHANLRTKKSRITHRLHHCFKRKSTN